MRIPGPEEYTLEKYMIGRGIYGREVVLVEDGHYKAELLGNGE